MTDQSNESKSFSNTASDNIKEILIMLKYSRNVELIRQNKK